jgi:leader peptidase (prepilin peptidase)/N-methyltransferase
MRLGPTLRTWLLLPVFVVLAAIIVTDLWLRLIPNRITVPSIIYALSIALLSGLPGLGRAVAGAAIAGGVILLLALISRGGIGGGDLKLMVLIGALLGWESALTVFVISQILALAAALVVSVAQRRILRGWLPIGAIIAALAAVAVVTGPV